MNNPIMALAQMAMNRISSDPSFRNNPQAKAFVDIMQRGDIAQGQEMAKNLCQSYGVAQLSFAIGGDTLPESTMVRQITTANAFDSITISDLISVNCCDFDRLTVTNTGAVPVVISTNPLLYIKRVS